MFALRDPVEWTEPGQHGLAVLQLESDEAQAVRASSTVRTGCCQCRAGTTASASEVFLLTLLRALAAWHC